MCARGVIMMQNKLSHTVCVGWCWAVPSVPVLILWHTCVVLSWKCYSTIYRLDEDRDAVIPRMMQGVLGRGVLLAGYVSGMPASVLVVTSLLLCPGQFQNGFRLNKLSFFECVMFWTACHLIKIPVTLLTSTVPTCQTCKVMRWEQ
jgi:hypothetical protein